MSKTAKLFVNGGSQAVRLPAEFRFEGTDEVHVRRDAVTGDIVLSARPDPTSWADFFAHRDAGVADGFLTERPLNEPIRSDPFDEDE